MTEEVKSELVAEAFAATMKDIRERFDLAKDLALQLGEAREAGLEAAAIVMLRG